jgi:hypothetical protein
MYLLQLDSRDMDIERHFDKIMNNDSTSKQPTSLIWSRTFGDMEPIASNTQMLTHLDKVLATYNKTNNNTLPQNTATHIAVGHTPQIRDSKQIGINSICNDRVWRCDVGMSRAFSNLSRNQIKTRKIQVLEILDGKPRVLSS